MVKVEAKQLILSKYASYTSDVNLEYDTPDSNFTYTTKEYDTEDPNLLKDGELLIKTIYLSNDPAQKGWFTPRKAYLDQTPLDIPAPSRGIAKVLKSKNDKFKEGDYLDGPVGWATYNVVKPDVLTLKIDPSKVDSLTHYISAYGITTITAWLSLFKYADAKPEEEGKVWLITGAAGAVGSNLVYLLDKLFKPKKIIAVAGGKDKVKYVESLGSDKIIGVDYKSSTYDEDFEKALDGDEINYFVDQVGGELLNKAFAYLAEFAHVVQVGAISKYNSGTDFVFNNYNLTIVRRLTIRGMVLVDDAEDYAEIIESVRKEFKSGKLEISKFKETIVEALGDDFKKVPKLWSGLFTGDNIGKYITKIAEDN